MSVNGSHILTIMSLNGFLLLPMIPSISRREEGKHLIQDY